jgi:hypothetical protein
VVVEGGALGWHRTGDLVRVNVGWWDQPIVDITLGDFPVVVVEE